MDINLPFAVYGLARGLLVSSLITTLYLFVGILVHSFMKPLNVTLKLLSCPLIKLPWLD